MTLGKIDVLKVVASWNSFSTYNFGEHEIEDLILTKEFFSYEKTCNET